MIEKNSCDLKEEWKSTNHNIKKKTKISKIDDGIRDIWEHIKHTKICIIRCSRRRQKNIENEFFEIMAENFPNLKKETYPGGGSTESQIRGNQRNPHQDIS